MPTATSARTPPSCSTTCPRRSARASASCATATASSASASAIAIRAAASGASRASSSSPRATARGPSAPTTRRRRSAGCSTRVRLEHMDREGIDHQVIYGSVTLAFNSLIDAEFAADLCRAYNDYIARRLRGLRRPRLHPVAHARAPGSRRGDPRAAALRRTSSACRRSASPPNLPAAASGRARPLPRRSASRSRSRIPISGRSSPRPSASTSRSASTARRACSSRAAAPTSSTASRSSTCSRIAACSRWRSRS